jgi:hypothetical protein
MLDHYKFLGAPNNLHYTHTEAWLDLSAFLKKLIKSFQIIGIFILLKHTVRPVQKNKMSIYITPLVRKSTEKKWHI